MAEYCKYSHPETGHKIESDKHDGCIELLEEVLEHARENSYPLHWQHILEGLLEEAEEYEADEKLGDKEDHLEKDAELLDDIEEDVEEMKELDEEEDELDEEDEGEEDEDPYESKDKGPKDGNPDEEINKFAEGELKKKGIKPLLTIHIGTKEKK
jgi:hypothetical protein